MAFKWFTMPRPLTTIFIHERDYALILKAFCWHLARRSAGYFLWRGIKVNILWMQAFLKAQDALWKLPLVPLNITMAWLENLFKFIWMIVDWFESVYRLFWMTRAWFVSFYGFLWIWLWLDLKAYISSFEWLWIDLKVFIGSFEWPWLDLKAFTGCFGWSWVGLKASIGSFLWIWSWVDLKGYARFLLECDSIQDAVLFEICPATWWTGCG